MKRIAVVLPDLGGGGAEKVALILANSLSEKFEVTLVLFKEEGVFLKYVNENVKLISLNINHWKLTNIPGLILKLRSVFKNIDVVVCGFQLFTDFFSLFATMFTKTKIISVVQINVSTILSKKNINIKYLKKFLGLIYKCFNFVICSSDGVRKDLIENFQISEKRSGRIYNPVYYFDEVNYEDKKCNFKENPIFITLARLNYQKRLEIMINSFAQFREKTGKGELWILGEGELKKYLVKECEEKKVENHVNFLGFKKDILNYLKKAHVFLLSSDFEGFGNVIVEAMAAGLPVISSDCPSGPREILENGKYGILTEVANAKEMSDEMIKLYESNESMKKYEKLSIERSQEFLSEIVMEQYENIIKRL
jgi:glycosyltransferase involved in cell wall biosynthesis